MNDHTPTNRDRLQDLMADRATQGLVADEAVELDRLLGAFPDEDPWALDHVAAAADRRLVSSLPEAMPAAVRRSVEAAAVAWLAQRTGFSIALTGDARGSSPGGSRFAGALPWLAAAACLVLALLAWWPALNLGTAGRGEIAARRDALLADAGTTRVAWNDVTDAGVSGDVVWNNAAQEGYLRFRGLEANDPIVLQYQLWIFDAARTQYTEFDAVDGGVFDVTADGEVLVPVTAKLEVFEPALFAVTTEPPGGVVRHDPERDPERYRIILTAPVP